jgi:hypothetical protein
MTMRRIIVVIGLGGVLAITSCGVPPAVVMSLAQTMSVAAEQQRQAAARWAYDLEQADAVREDCGRHTGANRRARQDAGRPLGSG